MVGQSIRHNLGLSEGFLYLHNASTLTGARLAKRRLAKRRFVAKKLAAISDLAAKTLDGTTIYLTDCKL